MKEGEEEEHRWNCPNDIRTGKGEIGAHEIVTAASPGPFMGEAISYQPLSTDHH